MCILSENIKKFRNNKNIKQAELAKLLGKSTSVIANWESGLNRPNVDSIAKMCEIFQIDANEMFGCNKIKPKQNNEGISLDKYAKQKGATPSQIEIIKMFLNIEPDKRDEVLNAFKILLNNKYEIDETSATVKKIIN